MQFLYVLVAIGGLAIANAQVTCYSCSGNRFQGNPINYNDCYDNVTLVSSFSSTGANSYCLVTMDFSDGISTSVRRSLVRGSSLASDFDSTTSGIPTTSACTVNIPGGFTTCYYPCNGNNCNTITTRTLVNCPSTCGNGYCNYLRGTCTCYTGYSGATCAAKDPVTYRSCVQCNEEIDSSCATKTTGRQCPLSNPASEVFCTTTKTNMYDASGTFFRSRISRGCTTTSIFQNQCSFSDPADPIFAGFSEETCISTCHADNCNTGEPNGILANGQTKSLYCVQCSGTGTSSTCYTATSRTLCPNTANQCYSKVVYYQSDRDDLRHKADPNIRLASVERGCRQSSTSVKSCTNTTLGSTNAKKVTCEESCTTDGCNDHWPVRSKCIQCSTNQVDKRYGYDSCLFNPPRATKCESPAHEFCYTSEYGRDEDLLSSNKSGSQLRTGYTHEVTRGCSYYDRGNGCSTTTVNDVKYNLCNQTCNSDECNQGSGSTSPTAATTLILLLPALLLHLIS